MRVFISWSGDRSKAVAEAFRDWIPKVLQLYKPWMSDIDIDKGAKWDSQISAQLAKTSFGLICLTPENRYSPAIHFEAGALSKYLPNARLWTYLYQVDYVDIKWPLSEFQHTKAEKDDTRKLLLSMNAALGDQRLSEPNLDDIFETWWHKLEERFNTIPESYKKLPNRSEKEILEEILQLSRSTSQTVSEIYPYEAPSPEHIRQLVNAFWKIIDRCDQLGVIISLIRPLRALQSSIQHLVSGLNLSKRDALFVYGTLNRTLLLLHPEIKASRVNRDASNEEVSHYSGKSEPYLGPNDTE